jgi:alpha-glucosidase
VKSIDGLDPAGLHWWQRGVIYQIYPRSFMNGASGVGTLSGIVQRLDYLVELGVDAVWLSPIFASPMADFGYDIADYRAIDPMFGTLADFDGLIAAAHSRGLKLILDFVPNHTSDRHPWFIESRSSRVNSRRDWYIWRDPAADGGAPNNWLSHFGGGAWTWDAATRQYYLHSFLHEQPDLNWRNAAVRQAMYDVLRFWLDRGVDGFRVDVLWLLIKDGEFRDNPVNPGFVPGRSSYERLLPLYSADRPEVHGVVREMRAVLDAYGDRVLIGEIYLPVAQLVTYYGRDLQGAQLPFNFALIDAAWSAEALAGIIHAYEAALPTGAWPNWVVGNHDKARIASRVGAEQARVAAMLLLTLRGTPTIYYGDELGMTDVPIPADLVQDPAEKRQPGLGIGRDPQRTPMRWDATPNAGFSAARPWLPLGDRPEVNVAALSRDPASILCLYRRLIALRRGSRALTAGALQSVRAEGDVLRYERRYGSDVLAIVLNLGHAERQLAESDARIVLSTQLDRDNDLVRGRLTLRAAEGLVLAR